MVKPIKDPENPLFVLTTPAQRALLHYRIDTIEKVATYTEKEIRESNKTSNPYPTIDQ